eukprot:scaffold264890_cov17-Tisochrysis_lutea.AAC.1
MRFAQKFGTHDGLVLLRRNPSGSEAQGSNPGSCARWAGLNARCVPAPTHASSPAFRWGGVSKSDDVCNEVCECRFVHPIGTAATAGLQEARSKSCEKCLTNLQALLHSGS